MTTETSGGSAPQGSLRALSFSFYIVTGLVLLALVTKFQKTFLPDGIATQIGHNSESFCLALAVAATIQFARPLWLRDDGRRTSWGLVVAIAVIWILLAVGVYYLGLPSSVKTLNEPLAAAGLLTAYFGLPRPLKHGWVLPAVVVVIVGVLVNVEFVTAQAETVTSFVLVALATDQFQRSILGRDVRDGNGVWVWWLFLAAWPALMQMFNRQGVDGFIGDVVDFQARGAEGFWGALLICLYFGARRYLERNETTELSRTGSARRV